MAGHPSPPLLAQFESFTSRDDAAFCREGAASEQMSMLGEARRPAQRRKERYEPHHILRGRHEWRA
jgi:hypothetical protein